MNTDKYPTIRMPVDIPIGAVAVELAKHDDDALMSLVLDVDAQVASEQWTRALLGKLLLTLEGDGQLFASVFDFLQWLIRMDDPADEGAVKDRMAVTLTEIIRRARLVHGQLTEDLPGGDR